MTNIFWLKRLRIALLLVCVSSSSHADEPQQGAPSKDPQAGPLHPVTGDDDSRDEFAAFPLQVPHEKHWVRTGIELGGVVILGFVDYLLNTGARGGLVRKGDKTFDYRYSWSELRSKLIGDAFELDGNRIGTNYVSHPFAGTMYFHVARSNHLSFTESLLVSIAASSTWEFFGEIRERTSLNDMIVTPVAGAVIGEATMQMSGFFDRGKRTFANSTLGFLFAPVKFLNYLADGAESEHADTLLPPEPWHRFDAYVGGGVTAQGAGRTTGDIRFGLDTMLANLPGYRGVGRHARLFDDGNVSQIRFRGAYSPAGLADLSLAMNVVPVGFYRRETQLNGAGQLRGNGSIVGVRIGFEYTTHDYDRDRRRPRDQVAIVSPVGIAVEHVVEYEPWYVKTKLEVSGSIAGVQPYALSDFRGSLESFSAATKNNQYAHSLGVGVLPSIEIAYGPVALETGLRLDNFRGLDDTEVTDRRMTARASLGWTPLRPLRLRITGERSERSGVVSTARAIRTESTAFATMGVVF